LNIIDATASYENWLRTQLEVNEPDLDKKHEKMADSPFPFLRATFYRWIERLPKLHPQLLEAPVVCAVGDLHVDNFGTWRDAEGRLVWGINDFDEAYTLPYTNDLIRLATSIEFARVEKSHSLSLETACKVVLEGYREALEEGGEPFVLEERHKWLRAAKVKLKTPEEYWQELEEKGEKGGTGSKKTPQAPSEDALSIIQEALPEKAKLEKIKPRQSGVGSLGRPRFVAIATRGGGKIAREVKAFAPSAVCWAWGVSAESPNGLETLSKNAVRCPDPFARLEKGWIVRRLAPYSFRIELKDMSDELNKEKLFRAMGYETGNVHLASRPAIPAVLQHLEKWGAEGLLEQASMMAEAMQKDYKEWRER